MNLLLLWWSGITLDTKMNDIGWSYVIVGVLSIVIVYLLVVLVRTWPRE